MPFFQRKDRTPDDPRPQIGGFWAWWAEHRDEVLAAADAGDPDRVTALLRPAVQAIREGLDWELSRGRGDSRHLLVVTSGGNTELRAVAERWVLTAPPADENIAYAATRPADPHMDELTLTVDDYELPLAEMVSGTRVDSQHGRVDVVVHHPLFPLLDEDSRLRAAFLALDLALGEKDVERWLGAVEVSADPPIDAIAVSSLGLVVDQLRPAEGGGWAMLEGSSPQGSVRVFVRRPFAPIDRPLCDTHIALLLSGATEDQTVQQLTGGVLKTLGGDGPHAVLVAYVLTPKLVTAHLYVDSLTVDPEMVRPVLRRWSGTARMHVAHDPGWREIGHLLS